MASFDLTQLVQTHRAAQGAILDHLRVWWRSRAFPTCRQCNVHVFNHGSNITSTGTKLLISARSQPVIAYEVRGCSLCAVPCGYCGLVALATHGNSLAVVDIFVVDTSHTQAARRHHAGVTFCAPRAPCGSHVPSPTPCTLYTG